MHLDNQHTINNRLTNKLALTETLKKEKNNGNIKILILISAK